LAKKHYTLNTYPGKIKATTFKLTKSHNNTKNSTKNKNKMNQHSIRLCRLFVFSNQFC